MPPARLKRSLDPIYQGATWCQPIQFYDEDVETPRDMADAVVTLHMARIGRTAQTRSIVGEDHGDGLVMFNGDEAATAEWMAGAYTVEITVEEGDDLLSVVVGNVDVVQGAAQGGAENAAQIGAAADQPYVGVIIAATGAVQIVMVDRLAAVGAAVDAATAAAGAANDAAAAANAAASTVGDSIAASAAQTALAATATGAANTATGAANTAAAAANAAAAQGWVDSAHYATPQLALDAAYAALRPCIIRSSTDVSINLAIIAGQTATERMTAFNALASYLQGCITVGGGKIWMVVPAGWWTVDGAALVQTAQHNKIFIRTTASPSQLNISSLTWAATVTPGLWILTATTTAALPAIVVPDFPVGIHNPVGNGDAELATGSHKVETIAGDRLSFTCRVQIPLTDASGVPIVPVNSTVMDYVGIDNGIRRSLLSVPRAAFGVLGGFDGAVVEGWVNARGGVGEQKWLGVAWLGANGDGCLYLAQDANSYWFFGDYDVICGGPERTFRGYDKGHFRFNRTAMGVGPSATGQIGLLQSGASVNMTRSSCGSSTSKGWEVTDHAESTFQQSYFAGGNAGIQTADGGHAEVKTSKISYSIRGAYASMGGTISYDAATRFKKNLRSMDVLAGGFHFRTPILEDNVIDMTPDVWVNGGAWISSTTRGIRPRAPVVKTSLYTAVEGDYILADTSDGGFTVNLPSAHVAGDVVKISDAAATWGVNNLTITALSGTIVGVGASFAAKISKASYAFESDGTDWLQLSNVSGPIPITAAAMAALTLADWAGQYFTVTNLGLKPVLFYCDGSALKPMSRAEVMWANRAPLAAYTGLDVWVPDFGLPYGSFWKANGVRLVRTGPITFFSGALAAGLSTAITGAGAETKAPGFTSPAIPGGVLNAGDIVSERAVWLFAGAAGTRRPVLRFGAADDLTGFTTAFGTAFAANTIQGVVTGEVYIVDDTTQLVLTPISLLGNNGASVSAQATGTVNTANPVYLPASCTMAGAGDTGILTGVLARIE